MAQINLPCFLKGNYISVKTNEKNPIQICVRSNKKLDICSVIHSASYRRKNYLQPWKSVKYSNITGPKMVGKKKTTATTVLPSVHIRFGTLP